MSKLNDSHIAMPQRSRCVAPRENVMIAGHRVIIVESEFLIALDIQRILENGGAASTSFARSAAELNEIADRWHEFDLAIVEVTDLRSADVMLAGNLVNAGLATVLTTAGVSRSSDIAGFPIVAKPFTEVDLLRACCDALSRKDG